MGASASTSVLPMNIQLIFFRIDWFALLAVQGTLKSLLQHHKSKVSILWHSAVFMVRLSHLYMTTRKTMALTGRIFVSKIMSLLFSMLSRFIIALSDQGSNLGPLHWERGVLASGPPGKSPGSLLLPQQ